MNKRDLLLLCSPSDNEKKLISLLKKLNNDNDEKLVAEVLAFKNTLLLGKSNLNDSALIGLLLKNYVLYLFSNENIEDNIFNNCLLHNDIDSVVNMLNNDILAKYYLSYIYVKTIMKGTTSRGLKIKEKNYNKVSSLIEAINYTTSYNEEKASNKSAYARCYTIPSNR